MTKNLLKPGQVPTREQLFSAIENPEEAFKMEVLNNLLNQEPHISWVKSNNGNQYLPIDKVEFMLTYIFQVWSWEIKREGMLANSVFVTGTLKVRNPLTMEWLTQDGTGAVPIQLDKSVPPHDIVRASDLSRLKAMSIQMNLPAASSYALSNAAGRLGKIFGRDLNRKDTVQFIGGFGAEEQPKEEPKQAPQLQTPTPEPVVETIPVPTPEPVAAVSPGKMKIVL